MRKNGKELHGPQEQASEMVLDADGERDLYRSRSNVAEWDRERRRDAGLEETNFSTFLFVTKPGLDVDIVRRERGGSWSCSSTMRAGDEALVYETGGRGIICLWRAISDARPDPEWKYVCEVEYVGDFDPPVPINEIKQHVTRDEWAAPYTNFRGCRAIRIPHDVATRLKWIHALWPFGPWLSSGINEIRITEISLRRTPCYGECPVDEVILRRDGTATYIGSQFVERLGQYKAEFWTGSYERLTQLLETQGFFELEDGYSRSITDCSSHITSAVRDGKRKTVNNYADAGPAGLWAIEMVIRALTEQIRWKLDIPPEEPAARGRYFLNEDEDEDEI